MGFLNTLILLGIFYFSIHVLLWNLDVTPRGRGSEALLLNLRSDCLFVFYRFRSLGSSLGCGTLLEGRTRGVLRYYASWFLQVNLHGLSSRN
jgi:hypothetical protein